MKKTYHGSCHCGTVRFACELDLAPDARASAGSTSHWYLSTFRCNCSFCTKTRLWKAFVKADEFRLLQGRDALSEYRFGREAIHHYFCSRCGVRGFSSACFEQMGGDFYGINLACLDDVSPEELIAAPRAYENGRDDDWESAPAETRHL